MGAAPKPNIDVCKGCGKLYPRTYVRLCQRCVTNGEARFALVRDFLRDNPGSSVSDVAEGTGLSRGEIARFYDEGRLVEIDPAGSSAAPRECTCTDGSRKCPYCRFQLAQQFGQMTSEPDRRRTLGEIVSSAPGADLPEPPRNGPVGHYGTKRQPRHDDPDRVHYVRRIRRAERDGE